ncbi:hypothetical protein T492DRAFT_317045 [Pavlovales sp. CCMP2436]|nr:hypothetical protein T492DRAFT_317045 [Pavlovales sp. CCMP2436]
MRLALALLLLVAPGALGTDPIPTGNCGDSAYFDIDSLRCTTCPDGQRVVASGLACECAGDTVPVSVESAYDAGSDDYTAHCVACSTGLVPERASLHAALGGSCVPCGEDADPSSEVDFGTGTVADMLANYTVYVTCPNTTVSDPTLGECTGLEAPEARCTTSDDAAEYPECACPTGYVLAETNQHGGSLLSKRCELCAANAYPHLTDPRACTACDDPLMLWSGSGTECDCPSGWTTVTHTNGLWGLGSSCVLSSARSSVLGAVDDSTASRVTYSAVLAATSASGSADSVTLDSATLAQLFVPSAAGCLVAVTTGRSDAATPGRSACQALANLCVLADYDPDSASCKAYRFIQTKASGSVNGQSVS